MMQSHRHALILFVIDAVKKEPSIITRRFAGKTLCKADLSRAGFDIRYIFGKVSVRIDRLAIEVLEVRTSEAKRASDYFFPTWVEAK